MVAVTAGAWLAYQLTVTDTNLAVVSNRTRDTERLQTLTDIVCCLDSILGFFLQCNGSTNYISPLCVLETDHLCLLASLVRVDASSLANFVCLLDRSDTVCVQTSENLLDTTVL